MELTKTITVFGVDCFPVHFDCIGENQIWEGYKYEGLFLIDVRIYYHVDDNVYSASMSMTKKNRYTDDSIIKIFADNVHRIEDFEKALKKQFANECQDRIKVLDQAADVLGF